MKTLAARHPPSLLVLLAVPCCLAACDLIYSYKGRPDAGHDAAPVDGSSAPGDFSEGGALFDVWPRIDLGGKSCSSPSVPLAKPLQVSVSAQGDAKSPSIAAVGNVFYVAFVENGEVWVRPISPFPKMELKEAIPIADQTASIPNMTPADPWITPGAPGKLALVWSETPNSYNTGEVCPRTLKMAELSPNGMDVETCEPAPESCKTAGHGFVTPSLAWHAGNGSYLLGARVNWNATSSENVDPCDSHPKGVVRTVSACTKWGDAVATKQECYNDRFPTYTWHIVAAVTSDPVFPYAAVRLFTSSITTGSKGVSAELALSKDGLNWGEENFLKADGVINDRPAVISDGEGLWLAWGKDNGLEVHYRANFQSTSDIMTSWSLNNKENDQLKEPFLAHLPAASGGGLTVLVYVAEDPQGIKLSRSIEILGCTSTAKDGGRFISCTDRQSVVDGSEQGCNPRRPVVAAGQNGFGVAWECVSGDKSGVFFKWVGCQ